MTKPCSKCREEKTLDAFAVDRRRPSGRQCWCKACQLSYRCGPAVVEAKRAYRGHYRRNNAGKVNADSRQWADAHPEKIRATQAKYYRKNKKAALMRVHLRLARKRNASGRGVTLSEWQRVLDESLGICCYCNRRRTLTMEHIAPLSAGGEHDGDNLAAACGACNKSKGKVPLLLWLAKRTRMQGCFR